MRSLCSCLRVTQILIRSFSSSNYLQKGYEQWPIEKLRRIGRRPTVFRGQGGKKSRLPYDKRYGPSGKDVNETTEGILRGGNDDFRRILGEERKT